MNLKFYIMVLLLCISAILDFAQGFVVIYPQEPKAVLSVNFTVFINENPVSVYAVATNNDVSYAHFAFAGKVTVRIHVSQAVNKYNLSPHSYGIVSSNSGQDITFELDRPRKLLLKEVNSLNEHLCIFADSPEDNAPKIGDANVVNIMDKGGNNTAMKNNLTVIQNALNALPSGGILYFPPGRYITGGDITMKSDRSIYLAGGAAIEASASTELRFVFTGANNARLFGRGSIDGRGDNFRPGYGGEGGNTLLYANGNTNNCRIEGIVVKGAITWTSIVMGTKNWNVYNLKIVNGRKFANHDSWDPHSAVNMMVDDCFFYGTDDAIAYSILEDNLDLNSIIRNSVFYNGLSGATVRIGPWVGKNTKHITVENNDHLNSDNENCLAFYLGGSITGLRYLNNRVENAKHGLILIKTNWTDHYAGIQSGSADDIIFDHLTVEKVEAGWDGHASTFEGTTAVNFVRNITFKDYYQKGVLQTSKTTADLNYIGSYVTNVQFTTSNTPIIDIKATKLFAYRIGSDPGKFTISRTGGSHIDPLTVNFFIHGTAVNGKDYTTIQDSVVIPGGSSEVDILIKPDSVNSSDYYKTVFLSLSSNANYILGTGYHAVVTIVGKEKSVGMGQIETNHGNMFSVFPNPVSDKIINLTFYNKMIGKRVEL